MIHQAPHHTHTLSNNQNGEFAFVFNLHGNQFGMENTYDTNGGDTTTFSLYVKSLKAIDFMRKLYKTFDVPNPPRKIKREM
jgi:hypothetical protein